MPDAVLEYSSFKIRRDNFLRPYEIFTLTYYACVLEHEYTRGSDPFYSWLRSVLDELTLKELQKLPEASRPPYLDEMIEGGRELFVYRDLLLRDGVRLKKYEDKMTQWYAEWEETQAARVEQRSDRSPWAGGSD